MTEPVFEIINKKGRNNGKNEEQKQILYNYLLKQYLSHSYGYYAQVFLKQLTQKVQSKYEDLRKFPLRKIMRQIVTKYLMNDLQIIFMSHFANLHQWNFNHIVIEDLMAQNQDNNELNQINKFRLFLNLVCFFVKSYVGSKQEILAIIEYHKEKMPQFDKVYDLWKANNQKQLFNISPRELNSIYSEFSRNSQKKVYKKDYNEMVDKILELSTTYSIMPQKQKSKEILFVEKKSSLHQKELVDDEQNYERYCQLNNSRKKSIKPFQSGINFNYNNNSSFRFDFSDLRSNKKQSIILAGGKSNLGELLEKKQKSQLVDSKSYAEQNPSNISKHPSNNSKKISLNKKKKDNNTEVNNVTKSFFGRKDINLSLQDMKKNQSNIKETGSINFLDLNGYSDKIQSIPFNYRNNSNIFGPSTLF